MTDREDFLQTLFAHLSERAKADPAESYTAKLLAKGTAKAAQKLGEEAVETAIAAVQNDREEVIKESADVLYHLMVVWLASGVSYDEVAAELAKRQGISGLTEKAARG